MNFYTYTEPTREPLDLEDLKRHMRVTATSEDALIWTLIRAARLIVEEETGRALVTQTVKLLLDNFPGGGIITLPRPPLQSVTSVKYYDQDEVLQTLSSSYYRVDTVSVPGRICLKDDYSWPTTDDRENAVEILYIAGYGDYPGSVPEPLRQAMRFAASHWYSFREPVTAGSPIIEVPQTSERLLAPFKLYWRA